MKVDLTSSNPALESIFSNPNQIITLDANFLIPPDRSKYAKISFDFLRIKVLYYHCSNTKLREELLWIFTNSKPSHNFIKTFSNFSIHTYPNS